MASVESIGACSLDFETSAADNFLTRKDLTASECTLHSNGLTPSSFKESSTSAINFQDEQSSPIEEAYLNKSGDKKECTIAEFKLPSYVSISCAINGYTNYSRFCRSRDNSPARASFRKSSFEPSMLADMNGKESDKTEFKYSRSQSDCNGKMLNVYTESKNITVNKQLEIPIKSTRKYMTEIKISNGHNEILERISPKSLVRNTFQSSPKEIYLNSCEESLADVSKEVPLSVCNGHTSDNLALAKEVGNGGTKSLVQQRIESLYGKSASEEIKMTVKHVGKREHANGVKHAVSESSSGGKPHKSSTSPPVFRHLNKDFRKQLQGNVVEDQQTESDISMPMKKNSEKHSSNELKTNGFALTSNGNGHDEYDRAKSKTPPPKLLHVSHENKTPIIRDKMNSEEEREGYKFLNLVDMEKEKIQILVKMLEKEMQMNPNLPEDVSGKIRAACGKANLLVSQKFEQFRGLCWKNIEDDPHVPFYTTASDLAGFWDLVMLQIEDINSTFSEIELMRNNNWKEALPQKCAPEMKIRNTTSRAVSRSNPSTPKRSSKSSEFTKAREEARKQLLAAKKKGRQQNPSIDSDIAIFTPASSN